MYTHDSVYHHIIVKDIGQLRVLQFEHNRQSSMYLDAPFDTDMEYPSYLHLPVAVIPHATRALVVGLGGGTVVKRMWRDYDDMRLDVVELDAEVVDVAREFFALPEDDRIRVFVDDGRRFLATTPETYDIVVIDAFDDDRVPRPLTTEEFLRLARDRTSPDGAIAYNFIGSLAGERSKPFRSLYRTLANVWRHVWVFHVSDGVLSADTNIVLLASDAPLSTDDLLDRIADRVGGKVSVPAFHRFGEDLYARSIPTADVALILDEGVPRRPTKRR